MRYPESMSQTNHNGDRHSHLKVVPALLLLCVLAGCLFFLGLGSLPLLEPDEGRNAEVAREMLASGDWITPHYDGLPYLDKPAFFFWLAASTFKVAGVHEWSARLPSAVMGLGLLLLSWFLARRMFDARTALRAGMVIATAPLVVLFSRLVIFDMTLACLVTLAMVSFWLAEAAEFRRRGPVILLFLAMGLGAITKGPVAFLLPLLSIVAYQALRGKLRELQRLPWALGSAVFLAAALPWFISISTRYPDFPRYAFLQESLARFSGGFGHRRGSPFYYLPVYLAGFFPWSIFLLWAGWSRLKRWKELRLEENRPTLYLLTWGLLTFVFFSISGSKLPGYFLPALVPLGILAAKAWGDVEESTARPPDWLTAGFATLLGMGILVAASSQLALFNSARSRLAKELDPAVFALVKPSLFYTGLILAALAIVGRNLAARARGRALSLAAFSLAALTAPLLIARWVTPLRVYAQTNSSRRLAQTIRASPERELPLYGYYYFRTSLPFYLGRPVGLITTGGEELTSNYWVWRIREIRRRQAVGAGSEPLPRTWKELDPLPLEQRRLLDIREFIALAHSAPQPRLILVRNSHVDLLAHELAGLEPLWNGWDFSVWKIERQDSRVRSAGFRSQDSGFRKSEE